MYDGYEKEVLLAAQEDIEILGDKPDAETGDTTVSDASSKIKRNIPLTPLQAWTKTKRIIQNKDVNAKKPQKGVVGDVVMLPRL